MPRKLFGLLFARAMGIGAIRSETARSMARATLPAAGAFGLMKAFRLSRLDSSDAKYSTYRRSSLASGATAPEAMFATVERSLGFPTNFNGGPVKGRGLKIWIAFLDSSSG